MRPLVTLRCEYPGTDMEPTLVSFTPGPELGSDPATVHAIILGRLALSERLFLPVEGGLPLEVWSETGRAVVAR